MNANRQVSELVEMNSFSPRASPSSPSSPPGSTYTGSARMRISENTLSSTLAASVVILEAIFGFFLNPETPMRVVALPPPPRQPVSHLAGMLSAATMPYRMRDCLIPGPGRDYLPRCAEGVHFIGK